MAYRITCRKKNKKIPIYKMFPRTGDYNTMK